MKALVEGLRALGVARLAAMGAVAGLEIGQLAGRRVEDQRAVDGADLGAVAQLLGGADRAEPVVLCLPGVGENLSLKAS